MSEVEHGAGATEVDVLYVVVRIAGAPTVDSLRSLVDLLGRSFVDASIELQVSREDVDELTRGSGGVVSIRLPIDPVAAPRRPIVRGHLVDGEFQSDKYPTTPRGKVPLSVRDRSAQDLLWEYSNRHQAVDDEFSHDLQQALRGAGYDPDVSGRRWPTDDLGVPELAGVDLHLARQGFHRIGRLDDAGRRSLWLREEKDALELRAGREGEDESVRLTPEHPMFARISGVLSAARFAAEWEDAQGQALDPSYLADEDPSSVHRMRRRLDDDRLDQIVRMLRGHQSFVGEDGETSVVDREEVAALVEEVSWSRAVRARARRP